MQARPHPVRRTHSALHPRSSPPSSSISAVASALPLLARLLSRARRRRRHPPRASFPLLNAILNALCTIVLVIGFRFIRRRQITAAPQRMFARLHLLDHLPRRLHRQLTSSTATCTSTASAPGGLFYWKLLASHILLSIIALPMILITFFLSLTGRFPAHKTPRPLDLPHLALRLRHRSHRLRMLAAYR